MSGWLLFFFSLPTKPVGNRVKVWRRLSRSGSVQLEGAVYVLPERAENREFFQWLAAEVVGMGGQAAFVRVDRVETVPDAEIVGLFERRTSADYRAVAGDLERVARKVENARQSGGAGAAKALAGQLDRVRREFEEVRRTDFFASAAGADLEGKIARTRTGLESLLGLRQERPQAPILSRRATDYQRKRWVTREAPFVDRMASAWLIRRFVDPAATFGFVAGEDAAAAGRDAVTYDMVGGDFTHTGDLCTFEVIMKAFGLEDEALLQLAEIVHDLDVRDDRRRRAEAAGVEAILDGIRRAARDDADALERGIAVFEALFAAHRR